MPESTPPSDPAASFREGQKLAGCYLLHRRVPDTGSRTVWIAHDEVLGKDVSLHFVPPAMLAAEEALAVLRHEVRRNRQLIHPSILRVYDFVEEGDWAAVSMDAFTGGTLAARQAATPHGFFEPAEIKAWLESICQTLDDAHRVKLAHGDVTPENIVVEEDGRVRLANFGMSICIKHALGELEGDGSAHQSAQQLEGAAPTPADDVFGAGVLIHRLLVGAPPFGGPGERGQAPGLAEHRAQLGKSGGPIPAGWEKIVAACLARDPGARPKSAADIVPGLELAEGSAVPEAAAKEVPEKKSKKKTAAAEPAAPSPEPIGPMSPMGSIVPEPTAAKPEETPAAEPAPAKAEENAAPAPEPDVAKMEEQPAPPEPEAAKADAPPAPAPEPEVVKAEEKPAPEPEPEAAKTAEAAEAVPANIVEAPPGSTKRSPRPELKPEPARSTPRKQPARSLVDDEDDDYAPGGGGMSGKTMGIAAVVIAVMVGMVMYFVGGDEKKPDVPSRAPEPTPVAKSTPAATTPIPAPTPAPVKPNGPETKPPVAEPPKKPAPGETNKEPAPATPKPDKPEVKPATPAPDTTAKAAELEAARKGLDAAEKTVQEAQKKKQDADDALAAVKAKIEEKSKSLTPLQKAADEVIAGQKKREADARAAAQAAEQAKQAIPDKARLSDEARKALDASDESLTALKKMADVYKTVALKKAVDEMTAIHKKREDDAKTAESAATRAQQTSDVKASDADSATAAAKKGEEDGKAKLAAKESAANELKDLQKDIEDKQRAAAEATKALADAAAKRDQQAAVVQNATKVKETPPANAKANPKDATAEVKASEPPPEVKPLPPGEKPDPEKVKKDGQAMIDSLSEKLKHLGETSPSATVEPKPAPLETNPPPVTPNPATTDTAPGNTPGAPDTPKAARAGPGFVNSLGMKFAPVGDVLFCVWQTRFKDFEAFAKSTGLKSTAWRDPGFKQGPEHPVVNVTWNEATLFCKWLTLRERKDGLLAADQEYRLPTDLEWSAGVGLGEETGKTPESRDMGVPDVYPWGTQWPPPAGAGNYTGEETGSDVAIRGYSDNFPWTSPVGSFPPNKYGLYDMGGNVWQWMMDNWNGESRAKVLRGASWYNGALRLSLLSSCRVHAAPDSSTDNYGFRVIIAATGSEGGGKAARK